MYKIITAILIPVLVIVLIGTVVWGYQENQEKNSILIKAENQYQRAFHDLNFHIDKLHDELGKTLAVSSRKQLSPCLVNVWRLASLAQSDVGQLPLILLPFNKTEEFLANVSDFAYRIAVRDLTKDPLTEAESKTLTTLYENSKGIKKELSNVQERVIESQLRWMDVELALAQEDKQMDNTIIDGFKTINKSVEEFPEVDWGPGGIQSLTKKKDGRWKQLKGDKISSEEAKKKALSFLNADSSQKVEVDKAIKNSDYKAYSVTVKDKNTVYLDITEVGGHVVWMMKNREIQNKKLSYNQALDKVQDFLTKHNYPSMTPVNVEQYDNTLIFSLSREQNGVIIYPESVSVKVALDNGEVVGFQSADYIFNHKNRTIDKPKISSNEAKTNINPNLKVISVKQAIIENSAGNEVLTYEITGQINKTLYRIYINADNGDEEEIEKINENQLNLD